MSGLSARTPNSLRDTVSFGYVPRRCSPKRWFSVMCAQYIRALSGSTPSDKTSASLAGRRHHADD